MEPKPVEEGDLKPPPVSDEKRALSQEYSVWSVILDSNGDTRRMVQDPSRFPYHDIALVHALNDAGERGNVGTAFFVAPGLAVTAAHVVCHKDGFPNGSDYNASAAHLWFGYSKGISKGDYFHATEFFVHPSYNPVTGSGVDVAVIRVTEAASTFSTQTKSFAPAPQGVEYWLAGYPGEQPWNGLALYEAKSDYAVIRQDRLLHRIDATRGQSGSPVWWFDGSGVHVLGIHNEGTSASYANDLLANGAAFLNEDLLDWIFSHGGEPGV